MKEIGGYFELELPRSSDYHPNAVPLNSGRNALRWFLRLRQVHTLWMPHYICDSAIEAARQEGVELRFYSIDERWWPETDVPTADGEWLLYVNYFGILDDHVETLAAAGNLVVDNAQAFFATAVEAPALYSPRKFFGVADGGYLLDLGGPRAPLPADRSWERYKSVLMRVEAPAERGLRTYRRKESAMARLPVRSMSDLTRRILGGVDYDRVRFLRERNFRALHEALEPFNQLTLDPGAVRGPMAYPLLCSCSDLREHLARQLIYVPGYWREVPKRVEPGSREAHLARHLCALPIDHRYDLDDMRRVAHAATALLAKAVPEPVYGLQGRP